MALRLIPGRAGRIGEGDAVLVAVGAQFLVRRETEHDRAAQQRLSEAGGLFLEEREDPQRQLDALAPGQAAHLERDHHAERPVVAPAVAIGVAVRAETEAPLPRSGVARDQRADRVVGHLVSDRREGAFEVAQGVGVDVQVGVA